MCIDYTIEIYMNTFGKLFKCMTWGESHGKAMGVVIDGCPAGIQMSEDIIELELQRDIPVKSLGTPRKEHNTIQILSGIFEGMTLGTPISIIIPNSEQHSVDYKKIKTVYRPGHGELGYHKRYGRYDYRGGGRASGRECIARLAAGCIAKKVIDKYSIDISSRLLELGGVSIVDDTSLMHAIEVCKNTWDESKDSTGGVVEITAKNIPAGIGNPVFGKLNASIAYALMTIGGVKGVEQGLGFNSARVTGSIFNDSYTLDKDKVVAKTNNCGGTIAGISNGSDLVFRVAVKPTPSLSLNQRTVDWYANKEIDLTVDGRFDSNFTPRVAVVAESMIAIAILDQMMLSGYYFGGGEAERKS